MSGCNSCGCAFWILLQKNLIPCLYENVISPIGVNNPAGHKDYKNIWLLGISMGGLGALLYAKEHPETIKGILVLAPFLQPCPCHVTMARAGLGGGRYHYHIFFAILLHLSIYTITKKLKKI